MTETCQCEHRKKDHPATKDFACQFKGCDCQQYCPAGATVIDKQPDAKVTTLDFTRMMDKARSIKFCDFDPKGTLQDTRAVVTCCVRLNGAVEFMGLPKSFGGVYAQMSLATDGAAQFKGFIDHKLENLHIEFFNTPDSPRAALTVDGASITAFRLERDKGEPDSEASRKRPPSDIFLWFTVTFDVGNDTDAMVYTWRNRGSDFWWTAEPLQKELLAGAGK